MVDLTLQHVVMRVAALLLVASVHGYAVARLAAWLGDPGPLHDGRLSLNPLRHLDLVGSLVAVFFLFGWVRPVAIEARLLRGGRGGVVAVIAGAGVATLALPAILLLVRPWLINWLPDTEASEMFVLVETVLQLAVSLVVFNLLPIPPLTGAHLLSLVWPNVERALPRLQLWCSLPLALLVASGIVGRLMRPFIAAFGA